MQQGVVWVTFSEYEKHAERTQNTDVINENDILVNAALGLTGESGELADLVKKYLFQGHDLDKTKVISELGDILWYISLACKALHINLSDIPEYNIEKLKQRYPLRFAAKQSIHRPKEMVNLYER